MPQQEEEEAFEEEEEEEEDVFADEFGAEEEDAGVTDEDFNVRFF